MGAWTWLKGLVRRGEDPTEPDDDNVYDELVGWTESLEVRGLGCPSGDEVPSHRRRGAWERQL